MSEPGPVSVYGKSSVPIAFGPSIVSALLSAGDQALMGFSAKEASGSLAAEFWLIDGNDANGTPIAFVTLSGGQSVRDTLGPCGVLCTMGLFVRMISGSVQLSVWVIDL
jgi:hypothetical protein